MSALWFQSAGMVCSSIFKDRFLEKELGVKSGEIAEQKMF